MSSPRHVSLLAGLVLALAVTGGATTVFKPSNPVALPTGLDVASDAESTVLYCTGLTNAAGGLAGTAVLLNTTSLSRDVRVQVVSDTGLRTTTTVRIAPFASQSIHPDRLVTGHSFGIEAIVSGGGVVGAEVVTGGSAQVPCTSSGVTDWYGVGFDTSVGTTATLSLFNPTATPAVVDVTALTSSGFVAPAPFQGLSVSAHAEVVINLGSQIVNMANVAAHVKVLRGAIDVVGVERSGSVVSLNPGSTSTTMAVWFPRVTTAQGALAQIRVANPGTQPAHITISVSLAPYHVNPFTMTVAPFATGTVILTPSHSIPAAGYASATLTSNVSIVASLVTGTNAGVAVSAAFAPAAEFLLRDFTGRGFNAATVTNTSDHPVELTFSARGVGVGAPSSVQLAAHSTSDILGLYAGITTLKGVTLRVRASRAVVIVTATLPTTPAGTTVVSPLYGG